MALLGASHALLAPPAHASKHAKSRGTRAVQAYKSRKAAKKPSGKEAARRLIAQGIESIKRKRFADAIRSFQKAAEADGTSAEAFAQLGHAYYGSSFKAGSAADAEDTAQAVEAYETALALDPGLGSVKDPYILYHSLAMANQSLGKYDKALEALKKAMAISPDNPMPSLYAAEIRYRLRDYPRSAENLHLSVRRAVRIRGYRSLAKLIRSDPGFSGLLALPLNQSILETYDQVEAGTLTETQARDKVLELASFRDALSSAPSPAIGPRAAPDPDPKVQEHLERADAEFKFRHWRAAIEGYRAALEEDRGKGTLGAKKARIFEAVGVAYRQLGQAEAAVRVLQRAAQELPESSAPYYQMALAYSVSGRLSKALQALDQALQNAQNLAELRKLIILSKTDPELDAVRDLPEFRRIVRPHAERLQARR